MTVMPVSLSLYDPQAQECYCDKMSDDLHNFVSEHDRYESSTEFILTRRSGTQVRVTHMYRGVRSIICLPTFSPLWRRSDFVLYGICTKCEDQLRQTNPSYGPLFSNIAVAKCFELLPFSRVEPQMKNIFPQALLGLIGEYYGSSLESLLPPPPPVPAKDPWFEPQNYGMMHL